VYVYLSLSFSYTNFTNPPHHSLPQILHDTTCVSESNILVCQEASAGFFVELNGVVSACVSQTGCTTSSATCDQGVYLCEEAQVGYHLDQNQMVSACVSQSNCTIDDVACVDNNDPRLRCIEANVGYVLDGHVVSGPCATQQNCDMNSAHCMENTSVLSCEIPDVGYHIDTNGLVLGACTNQTNCLVHEIACLVNSTYLECNTAHEGFGVLNGYVVLANESCLSQTHCVQDGTECVSRSGYEDLRICVQALENYKVDHHGVVHKIGSVTWYGELVFTGMNMSTFAQIGAQTYEIAVEDALANVTGVPLIQVHAQNVFHDSSSWTCAYEVDYVENDRRRRLNTVVNETTIANSLNSLTNSSSTFVDIFTNAVSSSSSSSSSSIWIDETLASISITIQINDADSTTEVLETTTEVVDNGACFQNRERDEEGQIGSLWWVGVIMSIAASISSNMGVNTQKLSFLRENVKSKDRQRSYIAQPYWLFGLLMIIAGSLGDFAALGFAAQSLIAPVGGVAMIANIFFAWILLAETVSFRDFIATTLIFSGIVLITIFGNKDEACLELADLIDMYQRDAFYIYAVSVLFTCVFMYTIGNVAAGKRKSLGPSSKEYRRCWRKIHRFCFPCLSGVLGAQSVIFAKSLSELIKYSFEVENQFLNIESYAIAFMMCFMVFSQLHFLAISLQYFDAVYVIFLFLLT
jgi:magnesium transporter